MRKFTCVSCCDTKPFPAPRLLVHPACPSPTAVIRVCVYVRNGTAYVALGDAFDGETGGARHPAQGGSAAGGREESGLGGKGEGVSFL